ncbi:MAG: hypothetical protein QM784_17280 [Polyangiaceae bacterium]
MATTSVRPPPADVVGRQFVRDPDLWLTSVAILAAVFSVLQLFVYPMGRSLAEFAISGREVLLGGAPAKTFWSLRAPGISILHAFVQRFLGPSTMAMRVVEIATLLVLAFATTKVMKRIADFERVGVIAASLALFVHAQLEFEHTGQPELYAACFVTLATLFALRTPTRHNRFYHYAAVGLFVSLATIFVPLFWLVLLPLGYRIARFEAKEREGFAPVTAVLVAVLTSLLFPLAVALWLHHRGALHVFVTDWVQPQSSFGSVGPPTLSSSGSTSSSIASCSDNLRSSPQAASSHSSFPAPIAKRSKAFASSLRSWVSSRSASRSPVNRIPGD